MLTKRFSLPVVGTINNSLLIGSSIREREREKERNRERKGEKEERSVEQTKLICDRKNFHLISPHKEMYVLFHTQIRMRDETCSSFSIPIIFLFSPSDLTYFLSSLSFSFSSCFSPLSHSLTVVFCYN